MGLDRRAFLPLLAMGLTQAQAVVLANDPGPAAKAGPAKDPLASRFGGPFALTDHTGHRVSESSWPGQFLLIYFGFTRCTDACPVDLPNLVRGLDLIAPLDARIQPLFVTVDPADTVEELQAYVGAFHPRLVGLTGTEAELAAVAKAYRVHRYRLDLKSEIPALPTGEAGVGRLPIHQVHGTKQENAGQRYSINHGTLTYLMAPGGGFLTLIPHASGGERIAQVLRRYVMA